MKSAHRPKSLTVRQAADARTLPINELGASPARFQQLLVLACTLIAFLIMSGCSISSFKDQPSYAKAHRFPPEIVPSLIQASGSGDDGDPDAQFKLSHAYAKGIGVRPNAKESLYWLQQSARQEYPHAMYKTGVLYAKGGLGLKKDTRKSILWFRRAAKYDQQNALMTLGHLRFRGKHVKQDFNRAKDYFCRAADEDNTKGMFYCGLMNTHPRFAGKVAEQDLDAGIAYLETASERGNAQATKLLPYVRPPEDQPEEEPDVMGEDAVERDDGSYDDDEAF